MTSDPGEGNSPGCNSREQETKSLLGTGIKHAEPKNQAGGTKSARINDSSKKRKRNRQWHAGFTGAEDWCQQQ
jgi:hypothetical protein